jgi:hypothetical protein
MNLSTNSSINRPTADTKRLLPSGRRISGSSESWLPEIAQRRTLTASRPEGEPVALICLHKSASIRFPGPLEMLLTGLLKTDLLLLL